MKYAVVTSTDPGYLYTAKALVKGLTMYGNECAIHLLYTDEMPAGWADDLPKQVHLHAISSLPEMEQIMSDASRGRPWQVRFARYVLASKLCDDYEVVAIWDSDSFVVGSLMPVFDWVANTRELAMPKNLYGTPTINKASPTIVRATQPTYHCHGAFFPSKYKPLLYEVYIRGLREPYGDMVALHRVLQNTLDTKEFIRALPNERWVCSFYWQQPVRLEWVPDLAVYFGDTRVTCVHGKWHNAEVRNKEVMTQIFQPQARIQAVKNLLLFDLVYRWFNERGAHE